MAQTPAMHGWTRAEVVEVPDSAVLGIREEFNEEEEEIAYEADCYANAAHHEPPVPLSPACRHPVIVRSMLPLQWIMPFFLAKCQDYTQRMPLLLHV